MKIQKFLKFNKFKFSKIDYSYDTREFLNKIKEYESQLEDAVKPFNLATEKVKGYATSEGTTLFSQRNPTKVHQSNFKTTFDVNNNNNGSLKLSTLGIGTYIGTPDDINDFYMYNAIKTAVLSGAINVIDTGKSTLIKQLIIDT